MKKIIALATTLCAATLLSACGGGSGNGGGANPPVSTLSATQMNFEAATVKTTHGSVLWYLPNTNIAPTSGTHYFVANVDTIAASPSSGPQTDIGSTTNFASTLTLPDMSNFQLSRVLKNGVIYVRNWNIKQVWSYEGANVLLTDYAVDGSTPLAVGVFDNWSAPIPLTGAIADTAVMKSFFGFTRLNTPVNFDFSKSWLAGASYSTRKMYRQSDYVVMLDWSVQTSDANVSPYAGSETTIEKLFSSDAFLNGILVGNITYKLTDGAIANIQGARMWIATNKLPASSYPTDKYIAFVELGGKIYFAHVEKAGTRIRSIDGLDTTIINDFGITLNAAALDSIKQTIKF